MPSIILGRERFALTVGETRVGGTGDGALPFAALRALPTSAVLLVTSSESVSLWPVPGCAGRVTVNGRPLNDEPVALSHGARIEVAGLRLVVRDSREVGATGETVQLSREEIGIAPGEIPTPETPSAVPEGARLIHRQTGIAVDVPDSGLVIGRDADSDLVVAGAEVSRRHAVLRRSERGYVLTDVSRNGTFVNDRRVTKGRVLLVGDVVRIGAEDYRFEAGAAKHDPAATPIAIRSQPLRESLKGRRSGPSGVWQRVARLLRP